jgi:UDP-glucose 4-epimerase
MANVLVTGGAGFMGSHLVRHLLQEGHNVRIFDNMAGGFEENLNFSSIDKKPEVVNGDLREKKDCEKAVEEVDIVYHLAASACEGKSVFTPVNNTMINYIGSLNLLTSAINESVKSFVFTSSMATYGKQAEMPMREDQLPSPEDPYGIAKASFERVLRIYSDIFGFDYVVIRPHNVYGPRQNLSDPYRNVIGIFMNRIMKNLPPIVYGDGMQKRAFTYIDDCIPYIARAAFTKKAFGEIINVGSEEVVTINYLADLVLKIMGSELKPKKAPARPTEVKFAYCSSNKARELLDYKTSTTLEQGVTKMAEWAKKIGPQEFRYGNFEWEINKNIPKVWKDKLL